MPDTDHSPVTLDELTAQGRNFATVPETASITGYDPRTVRSGCADGTIPSIRIGATYRIPVSWLRSAAAGITSPADGLQSAVPAGQGVTPLRRSRGAAAPLPPGRAVGTAGAGPRRPARQTRVPPPARRAPSRAPGG